MLKIVNFLNNRNNNIKGLTLPELLLAAAITVFALCGILLLFVNCAFLNEANRNLTTAMTHAQYLMEEIRGSGFSTAEAEAAINNGDWDLDAQAIESAPYNLTALNNELINTGVTQSGAPLGISVTVTWRDRGNRSRQAVLQTLMADYQ